MSTPFDIFDVGWDTGGKLVAALHLPAGLTTSPGTTIAGGTVTGTATVPTGATVVYLGLSESPDGLYGATSEIAATALPDTTTRPYLVEVRVVDDATDMTSYAAIAAAFEAADDADDQAYSRDAALLVGGMLKAGVWGATVAMDVDGLAPDVALKRVLSAVGGVVGVTYNPGGSITLAFKALDGVTTLFTRTFDPATGARS